MAEFTSNPAGWFASAVLVPKWYKKNLKKPRSLQFNFN